MNLQRQIKETRRATTAALTLEEKLAAQKQIKTLESQRNAKRRSLFDAQDEIINIANGAARTEEKTNRLSGRGKSRALPAQATPRILT